MDPVSGFIVHRQHAYTLTADAPFDEALTFATRDLFFSSRHDPKTQTVAVV